MTVIYQASFERTLDSLRTRFAEAESANIEAWTFDDEKSRRAAEAEFASLGIQARIRSAYKSLLHFFLEDVELADLAEIRVVYPVHACCPQNRFLLEAYPLAALTKDAQLTFEAGAAEDFTYRVSLTENGETRTHSVFAPNRVHSDFTGERVVSPTGWIRIGGNDGERLETDYEALFDAAVRAVASHSWGETEPYFGELNIAVTLPAADRRLPFGEEAISLCEAMHEDLYFSLLEVFQKKSGRPFGDRRLQPGQIVPETRTSTATAPSVRIETRPLATNDASADAMVLDGAEAPLSVAQIREELTGIAEVGFEARSRSGRILEARYRKGADQAVMISAGQHANETTGVVGALRAAKELAGRLGSHFTISPLENPDGYQLHWRLRGNNAHHMHHAARYTALGDDLEYREREPLFEKAIRIEAERLSGAKLHLNLHGYPSHEWTRPLSGYVPRHFEMWTLPKGFFLVMRHHEQWTATAEELVDRVSARLAKLPGLLEYNAAQISLFETHAAETGFRMINGIPCLVSADERHSVPLTFITEYPDETIYGEAFINGHTAQREFVLAAYEAYQDIIREKVA